MTNSKKMAWNWIKKRGIKRKGALASRAKKEEWEWLGLLKRIELWWERWCITVHVLLETWRGLEIFVTWGVLQVVLEELRKTWSLKSRSIRLRMRPRSWTLTGCLCLLSSIDRELRDCDIQQITEELRIKPLRIQKLNSPPWLLTKELTDIFVEVF